ncbi:hypothetical protein EOD41_17015 [Mucilaginibacter limnophilus]|uniref:Uncharacterized protein n=1 Tax=Mucilaginibacter limnophilus TaxID=1932778 RepID=A0A437MLI0_9SPHI|nr:hypothetical protein EOD41_17015 [Mucilaginibacter limnophilus]
MKSVSSSITTNRQNSAPRGYQPWAVLLLIIAFLTLSYCPLRQALQKFLTGDHRTEKTETDVSGRTSLVRCLGVVENSSFGLKISQSKARSRIPVPPAALVGSFCFAFYKSAGAVRAVNYGQLVSYPLDPVPIYLKNLMLLI